MRLVPVPERQIRFRVARETRYLPRLRSHLRSAPTPSPRVWPYLRSRVRGSRVEIWCGAVLRRTPGPPGLKPKARCRRQVYVTPRTTWD